MQFILSPLFTIQMQVHIFAVIPFTSKWPFSAAFDKAVCRYHPLFSSLFAPEDKSFSTTLRMGDLKTWKRYESKVFTTHLEKHQDLDPFLTQTSNIWHSHFRLFQAFKWPPAAAEAKAVSPNWLTLFTRARITKASCTWRQDQDSEERYCVRAN